MKLIRNDDIVNHAKYGTGKVTQCDEMYISVTFSGKEIKFPFPKCFVDGFLTLPNENDLKKIIEEGKELLDERQRRRQEEEAAKRIKVGRKILDVDDYVRYRTIKEAIEDCFGEGIWKPRKGYFYVGNGYYAWFPHLSNYYNGEYHATDSDGDCINYLKDGNETIVEEKANGKPYDEASNEIRKAFTFIKRNDAYEYIGVYQTNNEKSDQYHKVSSRIETVTDLSAWAR